MNYKDIERGAHLDNIEQAIADVALPGRNPSKSELHVEHLQYAAPAIKEACEVTCAAITKATSELVDLALHVQADGVHFCQALRETSEEHATRIDTVSTFMRETLKHINDRRASTPGSWPPPQELYKDDDDRGNV